MVATADADGRPLWGHNQSARLDIASTTKLMTAWVVLRMAETQPQVIRSTHRLGDGLQSVVPVVAPAELRSHRPIGNIQLIVDDYQVGRLVEIGQRLNRPSRKVHERQRLRQHDGHALRRALESS